MPVGPNEFDPTLAEGVVKGWIVFPGKAKMRAEAQFTRSK